MNDEFATLLSALQTAAGSKGDTLDITMGRLPSKIEVLDLAKKHILALEMEETELEDEGQTLQAQVEFVKSVYANYSGRLIP